MNTLRSTYSSLPADLRMKIKSLFPAAFLRWYANKNTDVYLISYPKCGRTWLRLMIGRAASTHFNLLDDEKILFLEWDARRYPTLPRINVFHDDRPMLKTPQELSTNKTHYKNKDVIFLVRDPRDVMVSSFFEKTTRAGLFGDNPYENRSSDFQGSLDSFIKQDVGSFDTILTFYNIWAANRNVPKRFLLVRYEDLRANTPDELEKVIFFLGFTSMKRQTINEAVEFSSFDHMRKMEAEGTFATSMLKPADQTNPESFKTRKGKIGGYKEYLNDDQIKYMNEKMRNTLSDFFGYNV